MNNEHKLNWVYGKYNCYSAIVMRYFRIDISWISGNGWIVSVSGNNIYTKGFETADIAAVWAERWVLVQCNRVLENFA